MSHALIGRLTGLALVAALVGCGELADAELGEYVDAGLGGQMEPQLPTETENERIRRLLIACITRLDGGVAFPAFCVLTPGHEACPGPQFGLKLASCQVEVCGGAGCSIEVLTNPSRDYQPADHAAP